LVLGGVGHLSDPTNRPRGVGQVSDPSLFLVPKQEPNPRTQNRPGTKNPEPTPNPEP